MGDPALQPRRKYVFRSSGLRDLQDKRTGHKASSVNCFDRVCGGAGVGVAVPPPVAAHKRNTRPVEPSHFDEHKRVTTKVRPNQYVRKGALLGQIMLRRIGSSPTRGIGGSGGDRSPSPLSPVEARSSNSGGGGNIFGGGGGGSRGGRATPSSSAAAAAAMGSPTSIPLYTSTAARDNPLSTEFRRCYERGDLPVQLQHCGVSNKILWKVEIERLDYTYYLPLFFTGLREVEDPVAFLATQGARDMISCSAAAHTRKVLPCIPQLIIPIKTALNTRIPSVIIRICRILQLMCEAEELIGQALVPYFRQILPVLSIFAKHNVNLGDAMEYGGATKNCGDVIMETLNTFERCAGEDAFINIKYLVPTYQSCQ
jgi:hypothetical protein